jgi:hypothetical protein
MTLYKAGKNQEAKEALKKALSRQGGFPGREEAEKTLAKI